MQNDIQWGMNHWKSWIERGRFIIRMLFVEMISYKIYFCNMKYKTVLQFC